MKQSFKTAAVACLIVFAFAGCAVAFAQAPAASTTPTPAPAVKAHKSKKGDKIEGTITAVDTTAGTVTIHEKKTNTDVVATVDSTTKYTISKNVGVSGLSFGDNIVAMGTAPLASGATTFDAKTIRILSPTAKAKKHTNPNDVTGSVVTTTPAITITTEDGTTVTINTTATTPIFADEPAALTDVAVGEHVSAIGRLRGTSYVADEIHIAPPHAKGGGKHKAKDA